MLCTFVNVDCNNDGIIDSIISGGVPLIFNNPSSSFNYTTINVACDTNALSGIGPGNYSVAIDSNWLIANGFTVNNITPNAIATFLPTPNTITILLNCIQQQSNMCLSGQVYCDADSSGTFTLGDIPLDSVPIILNSTQGQFNALTTITGNYSFAYLGNVGQGSSVSIDSTWLASNSFSTNNNPIIFNDAACISISGPNIIDFPILGCNPIQPPSNMCLSGQVYCDTDSSGTFNLGDIPLDSVPILITTPQGQQTAYTNLLGNYNFTYTGTVGTPTVVVIDPTWLAQNLITGFAPVTIQNTTCNSTGNGAIADFPLTGCTISPPQLDMCVTGIIYCDVDTNGQFGFGDIPLDSVPINIVTSTGSILNTYTNSSGIYSLTYQSTAGLPTIVSIDPVWLIQNGFLGNGVANVLNTPCILGGAIADFPLSGCNQNNNAMCVSGQVFCDVDSNGVFNIGDTPLDSVPISLIAGFAGNFNTITDSNGMYTITYQGVAQNPALISVDNAWLLSNGYTTFGFNPTTVNNTPCNASGSGGANVNFPINCGLLPNPNDMCISGQVFCDVDSNGIFSPWDIPIAQAPIILSQSTNPAMVVYTDNSGFYNAIYQGNLISAELDTSWLTNNGYTTNNNSVNVTNTLCVAGGFNANFQLNGCSTSEIINISTKTIQLFPNPFKESINLVSNTPIKSIQIIDLSGRLVKNILHHHGNVIPLETLENGNYLIKLISDKETIVKKIQKI